VTNAATEPAHRDLPRLAFFALGAMFFGLAVADRLVALFAGFSSLVLTIFLAWLLAFLIVPLVDGLVRRLHLPRGIAVALAYGLVLGCVALLVAAVAQVGVREAADLAGRTQEITTRIAAMAGELQRTTGIDRSTVDLAALVEDVQRRSLPAVMQGLAAQTPVVGADVLAAFGAIVIIVGVSLDAVTDSGAIARMVRRIVPNRHAETLVLFERTVERAFRGFLRVQFVLVLAQVGITLAVGLVFGLPYLFLLTVGTGMLMFIPFFGPPLALLPLAYAALAFRPDMAILIIGILVVSQVVLVNAIQPRLLRREVGLHPIIVVVALLLGSQIAGLWGALLSIPLCAIATLLARYVIDARAVNEVEGIELGEAVAAIQAEHPEVPVEEAVAIAADQAEEILESEQAAQASMDGPPELPLVGGALVPLRRTPGPAVNDSAS
jgi:predicted PurR-regulated permease PerM